MNPELIRMLRAGSAINAAAFLYHNTGDEVHLDAVRQAVRNAEYALKALERMHNAKG